MEQIDNRHFGESPRASFKPRTSVKLFWLLCWLSSARQVSTAFTLLPSDTQVPIGWQATLKCHTGEETVRGRQYWMVYSTDQSNGVLISAGSVFQSPEYSDYYTLVTDSSGLYNLIVMESLPEDGGRYRCGVACDLDSGLTDGVYGEAQLSVVSPTNASSPQCFVSPSHEIQEGGSASLVCVSSNGTATLAWYDDAGQHLSNTKYPDNPLVPAMAVHELEAPLLATDSGSRFTCLSTCLVEVFVKRAPLVQVQPLSQEVAREAEVKFVCTAEDGYPEEYNFTWFYNDVIIQETNNYRFNNFFLKDDGKKLIIPDADLEDNSAQITCQVTNTAGSVQAVAFLAVRDSTVTMETLGPIIVGVVGGLILLIIVGWLIWWRRRLKRIRKAPRGPPRGKRGPKRVNNKWSDGTFFLEERSAGYGPDSRSYDDDWRSEIPVITVSSADEDGSMMRETGGPYLAIDDGSRRGIYVINPEPVSNGNVPSGHQSTIEENLEAEDSLSSGQSTATDDQFYNTRL